MPEEINRIVTDSISDLLFTTEESANRNLLSEGIKPQQIYFVGNVMIDTLLRHRAKAADSAVGNGNVALSERPHRIACRGYGGGAGPQNRVSVKVHNDIVRRNMDGPLRRTDGGSAFENEVLR